MRDKMSEKRRVGTGLHPGARNPDTLPGVKRLFRPSGPHCPDLVLPQSFQIDAKQYGGARENAVTKV
jgi:hypothetical protein